MKSGSGSQNQPPNGDKTYGGMIKQPFIKVLRDYLFDLFTYLDSNVPNFFPMHEVITFWRVIQLIGPCLCAGCNLLWNRDSPEGKAISIISILYHIVPVEYRKSASIAVEFVYSAINIIFFAFVVGSALYFKKTAKLPNKFPSVISIYIHTVGYLIHSVGLNAIGEDIGRLINGKKPDDFAIHIVSIILSVVCYVIWVWFFTQISIVSFIFRPNSLMSVLSFPQTLMFATTGLVTFLIAIASQLSKYPSAVLTLIASFCYLIGVFSVFIPGTFIRANHRRLVLSASGTSCVFGVIMSIYIFAGRKATFAELFIFIVVIVLVYILSIFILKAQLKKTLRVLDDFTNKTITIDDIKKPEQIVEMGIISMQYAHPACHNWELFRQGTTKWPNNSNIWITFGKFVAIYPAENQLLSFIILTMLSSKLKGNTVKQMISQARTIYIQRETSLNPTLKKKLSKSSKNVFVTKTKIRHVWDLAIQGAINEMESSVITAYQSMNKARSFFNHLLSQYPNNRFVARAYYRFIQEIETDPKLTDEWSEIVTCLQRGVKYYPDRTKLLGYYAFPSIPHLISDNFSTSMMSESESFISDTENASTEVDNVNQDEVTNQILIIRNHIDELVIPGTLCIKIWNLLLFFGLILIPAILILVILNNYLGSLSQSLHYMYHLSYLRALCVQVPVFANRYLNEKIGFYPEPYYNIIPEAYGSQNKTNEIIRHLLKEVSIELEKVGQYRSYEKFNEYVIPVHNVVFAGIIPYRYYTNQKIVENTPSTLQGAMSDVAMSATKFIDTIVDVNCTENETAKQYCWDYQNTTMYLNPYFNYGTISDNITSALDFMSTYLSKNADDVSNLSIFICLFICVVYVLIILGILVYEVDSLDRYKKAVYNCLINLPKNVVSAVSESFRMVNKEDDEESGMKEDTDTDMNKQEENILKIFASSSDGSSMKSHDKTILIFASFFLLVCTLVNTCTLAFTFPKIAKSLNNNAPHLDYILGSSGFAFSVLGALDDLILLTNGHGIAGSLDFTDNESAKFIKTYIYNYTQEKLKIFTNYYFYARYGGEDRDVSPYALFEDAVTEADNLVDGCESYFENDKMECPQYYSCYPSDVQAYFFRTLASDLIIPLYDGHITQFDPSSEKLNQLWNMLSIGLNGKLLYPMFEKIVPEMERSMDLILPPVRIVVVIFLILGFLCVLIMLIQVFNAESKMRFALSFLIHCPPGVVLSNPKITDVLSGVFTSKLQDSTDHNTEFFDSIVESLPDSVIVCNQEYQVISANKATAHIYGKTQKDLHDTNIKEYFLNGGKFGDNADEIFAKPGTHVNVEYQKEGDDSKCFIDVIVNQIADNFVLVSRDVTQTVMYNTLIAEESAKSDRLLSSILPPNLVKRVQEGEKNISFGVQSATILFLDIVEFTPWCASNTAAMVMSTLNALFRKFDAYLEKHATMTKIKCIGDCYMCAGGIFVEINQPSVHAKETVEFGLEAISSVEENNKEMNLSLRIRVGINTGGPIVAGVLGTEKPTFEILGPPINMAQQMEHHGVPMKVHISRATYELIYGGSFIIKERGQIEIKNGSVLTYLVESKK